MKLQQHALKFDT